MCAIRTDFHPIETFILLPCIANWLQINGEPVPRDPFFHHHHHHNHHQQSSMNEMGKAQLQCAVQSKIPCVCVRCVCGRAQQSIDSLVHCHWCICQLLVLRDHLLACVQVHSDTSWAMALIESLRLVTQFCRPITMPCSASGKEKQCSLISACVSLGLSLGLGFAEFR